VTDAAKGMTRTFAEHLDRVGRTVGVLGSLGIGQHDRFAVLTLNSPEYLELHHAAYLGAGVINPLSLRFAPKELIHVLCDSGTTTCFVDGIFAPLIETVREEAGLEHVALIGSGDVAHTATYDALMATADPVILMYTGGTTGLPEGCCSTSGPSYRT
jgi:long-chain acyl-CoA synthetase